jgi:hypothetical protein
MAEIGNNSMCNRIISTDKENFNEKVEDQVLKLESSIEQKEATTSVEVGTKATSEKVIVDKESAIGSRKNSSNYLEEESKEEKGSGLTRRLSKLLMDIISHEVFDRTFLIYLIRQIYIFV